MRHSLATFPVAALLFVACGGGSDAGAAGVPGDARHEADALCACKDFECTKAHMQALNRIAVTRDEDIKQLDEAPRKQYEDAQARAAACQDALRPK